MEIDIESGWMMNYTLNQSVSGEMVVHTDGEELNVPMTIEATTTVEATRE